MKAMFIAMVMAAVGLAGSRQAAAPANGPIAAFVVREAARLAFEAQPAADPNWSRVRTLTSGTGITVTVRGSGPRLLLFMGASESELVVRARDEPMTETIARTEVLEVTRSVSLALRRAGIGAAIGVGLGAAFGCTRGSDSYASICRGAIATFGGIGTGLGALFGANSPRTEVVYRALSIDPNTPAPTLAVWNVWRPSR